MSENLFGLTVAADKSLDDLQCQRLLSENRKYQEVMLQYRCALKALESRLEILNEEFSLQHDRNPIESMSTQETTRLKNRIAWQSHIIDCLSFLLLKTNDIFRKAVYCVCLLYTSRCV